MRTIIKNKKGDMPSLIIVLVVIIFVMAVFSLIFSNVFKSILDELEGSGEFPAASVTTMNFVEDKTIPFLDYAIFFTFIAIIIGLIISSIYIDTHPALAVVFIIMTVVAILLAGLFANILTEVGETSELATTYNSFVYTKLLITHFPLMVFVVALIVGIVLYGKSRGGGYAGI